MAKRKRGGAQSQAPKNDDDFRPGNSKLTINSYEDAADSEDEFHINRDKVLLEDAPGTKKRKQIEDDMIEASDEEVLAYSDSQAGDDDLDDFDDEEDDDNRAADIDRDDDNVSDKQQDEDEDMQGWGDAKSDYYNADKIQTEEEALAEEQEARRLQQKRRKALNEADFAFNEDEWHSGAQGDTGEEHLDGVYTEVLPQLQISEDMTSADRLKMLKARYPEFEPLSKELLALQPLHAELAADLSFAAGSPSNVKFQALSAYLGSLAMYFALLTSGGEQSNALPMAPQVLREHDIMDTLVRCRENWAKVQDLQLLSPPASDQTDDEVSEEDVIEDALLEQSTEVKSKPRKKNKAVDAATTASLARRAARLKATEASLANLEAEIASSRKRKPAAINSAAARADDVDSDIGDESLTAHEAAEKARKKRSLRFYTSQIAQKANKRANAGRAAGGDDDLPRRERLRDRQDRLMKEAEKRGQLKPDRLGEDSGDEAETNIEREAKAADSGADNDVDEAYAKVLEGKVAAKKANKQARSQAYAAAREEGGKVVRHVDATIGPDGRREIGYQIQKNKGLTPKRSKDVKNPRVKKRRKYEDKTKKLASMKPIYKGGEGRGGYGGELTGIKKGLVRSVKL